MVVDQQQLKDQEVMVAELTKIKPGVKYNIMVDTPSGGPNYYQVSYIGDTTPPVPMYEEPPIEPIPASFPPAYQNSNNEGVEGLLTGRKCGNCVFFEAETGGNCSRWNAIARNYYWCAAWKTMEPVVAQPNQFTPFIDQTTDSEDQLYNFFLENVKDPNTQEPNLSNLLTPLDGLFSTYGAYIYGDALRRMVDSGNAYDFDNVPLNFFFTTQEDFLNAIEFVNNGGLVEFDTPTDQYDSVQQHLCTYTLSKKSDSTLPMDYPQSLTINLHGSFIGEPINILSQVDFVNGKIAYNPSRHVLLDSRFVLNETKGSVQIDLLKPSVRERILKFLNDNSKPYYLTNTSATRFIQWVGDRSFTSESWQELYNYLLTLNILSSMNQQLLTLIENTLGEELIDNPSYTEIPLVSNGIGCNRCWRCVDAVGKQ